MSTVTLNNKPVMVMIAVDKCPDTVDFWITTIMRDFEMGYVEAFAVRRTTVQGREKIVIAALVRDTLRSKLYSRVRESFTSCTSVLTLEHKDDDLLLIPTSLMREFIATLFRRYGAAVSTAVAFTYGMILGNILSTRANLHVNAKKNERALHTLLETARLMGLFKDYMITGNEIEVRSPIDSEEYTLSRCPFTHGLVRGIVESIYADRASLDEPEKRAPGTYTFKLRLND